MAEARSFVNHYRQLKLPVMGKPYQWALAPPKKKALFQHAQIDFGNYSHANKSHCYNISHRNQSSHCCLANPFVKGENLSKQYAADSQLLGKEENTKCTFWVIFFSAQSHFSKTKNVLSRHA